MKMMDYIKYFRNINPGPQHGICKIPDCTRNDLPQFLVDMGYKTGAEIGVWRGEFSEALCKADLNVFSIDPWKPFLGQGRSPYKQDYQDETFEIAMARLSKFPKCVVMKEASQDALRHFRKGSLDFVYIDGDHRLQAVIADILEWNKKVRPGGVVAGHDYWCTKPWANNVLCHVKPAVNACVEVLGIKTLYLFDIENRYPSWMWIKE